MADHQLFDIARRRYRQCYGAEVSPAYGSWKARAAGEGHGAVLGYRSADEGALFLEAYLDQPIESAVAAALGRPVSRDQIVEIGNFAADNKLAMINLWSATARDLAGTSAIVVATLTRPLRQMFARIGLPITEIAPARPDRLGDEADRWGSYYAQDPRICAGLINDGQAALNQFLNRRSRQKVA